MENAQTNDNVTNETATTPAPEAVADATSAPASTPAPAEESAPVETAPAPAAEAPAVEAPAAEAPAAEAPAVEAPAAQPPAAEAPVQAAPRAAESRPSRQPSMAEVMESDTYMTGVETLRPNTLLKGIVVRIDESTDEVMVDIGSKSEGIIPREHAGRDDINVGDEVEVVVIRSENDDGHPVLSKARADYKRLWRELNQAKIDQTALEGTVTEQVKGGLIVDLGVRAFVPARYVDTRHKGDLGRFVGRTIPVKILEIDEKRSKVIASHELASREERKAREEAAWANIEKDKVVEGVVQRITDFGAFIDLGGIDGLLHVREMSWGRVEHPRQIVEKGQKIEVLILDIDETTKPKRIALGLKQLQPDPWKKAARTYRPGQTVTGKVTRLAPTCAFVELEEGIEAIIPIAEMSEQRIKAPDEVLQEGQAIEGRIKSVEPRQRRITVSLKAAVQERERRETRSNIREINERGNDNEVRLGDVFGAALRAAKERGKERNERTTNATRAAARERALQAAEEEEEEWEEPTEDTTGDEVVSEDKDINSDSLPGALQEDTATDNQPDQADAGAPVADEIAGDESASGQTSPA